MNYYGVTRSTNTLSHYGVKGMKWGVRKAILTGNARALDRQHRKAVKKLNKLQDIALHSGKYAAKAAAYGAAAAGVGTLAVKPHSVVNKAFGLLTKGMPKKLTEKIPSKNVGIKIKRTYDNPAFSKINNARSKITNFLEGSTTIMPERIRLEHKHSIMGVKQINSKGIKIPNRIYPGIVAAGLGAKALQNAYRATHGRKYIDKANNFRREMDSAFKGTRYEGQYVRVPKRRKRRR